MSPLNFVVISFPSTYTATLTLPGEGCWRQYTNSPWKLFVCGIMVVKMRPYWNSGDGMASQRSWHLRMLRSAIVERSILNFVAVLAIYHRISPSSSVIRSLNNYGPHHREDTSNHLSSCHLPCHSKVGQSSQHHSETQCHLMEFGQ